MKILKLKVYQKNFDDILEGKQTKIIFEISPLKGDKFIRVEGGECPHDADGYPLPKEYEAVRLKVGTTEEDDFALVKIKSAQIKPILVENEDYPEGVPLKNEDPLWFAMWYIIELDEVIEKSHKHRAGKETKYKELIDPTKPITEEEAVKTKCFTCFCG